MNLLTKQIRSELPKLYAQDGKGDEAIVYVKFFTPDSNWTWYATEGEDVIDEDTGEVLDFRFFGLVDGFEKELGYFSLNELKMYKSPLGLTIERDLYWKPKMLKEIFE